MALTLTQLSVGAYTFQPRAAAGDGAGRLVVVGNGQPIYSSDNGASWATGTRPAGPYTNYVAVAYGNGRFVAIEESNNVAMWSADGGATWTAATLPQSASWQTIVWTGTRFVASAGSYFNTVNSYVAYSTDGSAWTQCSDPDGWALLAESLVWNGSYCLILSKAGNKVYKSADGIAWTPYSATHSPHMVRLAWNGSLFCGLKYNTAVCATSSDGISWTDHALPATLKWWSVAWNGARFFALAGQSNTATYATSFDGLSWSSGTLPASRYWEGLGISGTTFIGVNPGAGYLVVGTGDTVAETGFSELQISVSAVALGAAQLPLEIGVGAFGSAEAGISVAVIDASVLGGSAPVTDGATAAVWGPVVSVGGVDVTDYVFGDISIEAEEGSARIADLAIQPAPGIVHFTDWIGANVVIAIADLTSGTPQNAMTLFSGKVDLPSINLDQGLIALRCTDDFQNAVSRMTRQQLDALVGGSWSPVIFDAGAASWVYFKDISSTVKASVDMSPQLVMRKTDWSAKPVADLLIDDGVAIEKSVSVNIAERSGMVNRVDIDFGYRIPKMKAEGYLLEYDIMSLNNTSFGYWVRDGGAFLFRDRVVSAIESAGGKVVSVTWMPLPTDAQIIPAIGGGAAGAWIPNPATDPLMCLGFSAVVSFDYAQFIDESHLITVEAPNSIDKVGLLKENMSGSLEGQTVDIVASETGAVLYKSGLSTIPPVAAAIPAVGLTTSTTLALTAETDRAAANKAMETLIEIAKTRIYLAHRNNEVSFSVPLNAAIDLDKTIEIEAMGVHAKGKVRKLRHLLATDSGRATTDVHLAISASSGLGIAHPEDSTTTATTESNSSLVPLGTPTMTWNGGLGGDQVITVVFPGVEDAERQLANKEYPRTVRAPVAEDLFTITI